MFLRIDNLADRLEDIELIKKWLTQSQISELLTKYCTHVSLNKNNKFNIPMILIALLDEVPVGTISLLSDSMIKDNKYTPWIANMFVAEDKRNMGIGTYMHNYLIEEALTMGYEKLYVSTHQDEFFERLGWTYKETAITILGNETNLYVKELE